MPQQQSQTGVSAGVREKEPAMYDVVMLNDDFTTMEFVVEVLTTVFFKSDTEAEEIMLGIHREGSRVVGTYILDIARSKVAKATKMARAANFPLRLKVQLNH